MKLSFSLSSKPPAKQQQNLKSSQSFNDEAERDLSAHREYVTEFDSAKSLTQSQPKKLVIPQNPNEWRATKKMKNIDLPPVQSDVTNGLHFEVDPSTVEPSDSSISYGLNFRPSSKKDMDEQIEEEPRPPQQLPTESALLQKMKYDLKSLPETGFDEFTDVPVEGFGTALLAGHGWYEGRGIGRNAKEDVKAVEYRRRTSKEGIGFVELPMTNEGYTSNNGATDGQHRKQGKYYVGKDVRVVGGREMGLKGRVLEVTDGGNSLILKVSRGKDEIIVNVLDVAELGSVEDENCMRNLKTLKIEGTKDEIGIEKRGKNRNSTSVREDRREHRDDNYRKKDGKRNREDGRRSASKEETRARYETSWLTSHIRVRIISRELKGGRLYLKKGEVVDVVGPSKCDISLDETKELIQGVNQEHLETAIPTRGGPVLVLCGRNKGIYGSLVQKDAENETGLIRDADTHELINVRLEQIAEYTGDPSYIGY